MTRDLFSQPTRAQLAICIRMENVIAVNFGKKQFSGDQLFALAAEVQIMPDPKMGGSANSRNASKTNGKGPPLNAAVPDAPRLDPAADRQAQAKCGVFEIATPPPQES